MISRKQRRLLWLTTGLLTLAGAFALILLALGEDNLSLFRQPSDLVTKPVREGQRIRLGGLVRMDSYQLQADGISHYFTVTDCVADIEVHFKGLLPDLFREGQGIVSEGFVGRAGIFMADTVLAKHDENYRPKGTEAKKDAVCRSKDDKG